MTPPTKRSTGSRGGGRERSAPSARPWRERIEDPDEPLFTMAVAAELLGLDTQALRRLSSAVTPNESRPSGNQRRYSRNDLERLSDAADLADQGHNGHSISMILDLTSRLSGDGSRSSS